MRVEQRSAKTLDHFPDVQLLVLGALAALAVQMFRASFHRWLPGLWMEVILLMSVPWILFQFISRNMVNQEVDKPPRSLIFVIQGSALVLVGLVIFVQWFARKFGLGDANEIIALLSVSYVSWFLAVFSKFGAFGRTAFILMSSVVLFVCCMAERTEVFVVSFMFATTALWWMLGTYWNRLGDKALDGDATTLPVNGWAILIALVLLTAAGTVTSFVAPQTSKRMAAGISPFSGGDSGHDDLFARAGIGDGNMLTSGPDATTSGAVDSDQFIEDDKPSIYDISTEKFDGPVKIRPRRNRAQAIDAVAKHMHNVIQSEQTGKTFRTVRERKLDKDLDLKTAKRTPCSLWKVRYQHDLQLTVSTISMAGIGPRQTFLTPIYPNLFLEWNSTLANPGMCFEMFDANSFLPNVLIESR